MLERPNCVLVFYPTSIRVTCLNSAKPLSRVNRGGQRHPAIIREIQRSRRNEIFPWRTRLLQHAGQKETADHSPCNRSVHCLYNRAGNRTLGAPFGRTTGATVETSSNQGSGAQRILL